MFSAPAPAIASMGSPSRLNKSDEMPAAVRRRSRLSQQRRNGSGSPGPPPSIPEKWLRNRRVDEINALEPVNTRAIRGFLIPSRPASRSSSKVRLDNSWSEADMFPDLRHRLAPLTPSPAKPDVVRAPWCSIPGAGVKSNEPEASALAQADAGQVKSACGRVALLSTRDMQLLHSAAMRAACLPQPVLDVLDAWCVLHGARQTRWKPWSSGRVREIAHRSFAHEILRDDALPLDADDWLERLDWVDPADLDLLVEMFSPQTRPHFNPESVKACARVCAIAHQASVLCELLTASIRYMDARRREHREEDGQHSGSLRDSTGKIKLRTTADYSGWTLRTEERRASQIQRLTEAVFDRTFASLPSPQETAVQPPEPQPEPEPELEQPVPPEPSSSGPEILGYLRSVGWDKLLKQETAGECLPGDLSEVISEPLATSAWGEKYVSMAVRCGFPYRQVKGVVVVDTATGVYGVNSRKIQIKAVRIAAAELRQRIRILDPEEEALNRIAAAKRAAERAAKERELAEAARQARSLSGSAVSPTPEEPEAEQPAPGSDIVVPPPDMVFVVENRYADPNEAANKAARIAREKLAEKRAQHAETAARRKVAREMRRLAEQEEIRRGPRSRSPSPRGRSLSPTMGSPGSPHGGSPTQSSPMMSPKTGGASPRLLGRRKKKNKKGVKQHDQDDKDHSNSSDSEEEGGKKWVEAFRFSFNSGAIALVQCPLYSVCPAGAGPGDVIEVDLLGLEELCSTIPRTRPLPSDSARQKKQPAPDVIFPPDGGLVRKVLRTNAPPKLLLEIPAGAQPGKRFRTSFDGHAILTVTEIAPAPPDGVPIPQAASPLEPPVGGGAQLLEELWVPALHGKAMQVQQRVLEAAPSGRFDDDAPAAGRAKEENFAAAGPAVDVSRFFFEDAPPNFGGVKPVGLAAVGWAQHAKTARQLPLNEGAYEQPTTPTPAEPAGATTNPDVAEAVAKAANESGGTAGQPAHMPRSETEPPAQAL